MSRSKRFCHGDQFQKDQHRRKDPRTDPIWNFAGLRLPLSNWRNLRSHSARKMALSAGAQIGPYEVATPLGEGSMGVIDRAGHVGHKDPIDIAAGLHEMFRDTAIRQVH